MKTLRHVDEIHIELRTLQSALPLSIVDVVVARSKAFGRVAVITALVVLLEL